MERRLTDLWDSLPKLEKSIPKNVSDLLSDFEPALRCFSLCGVLAPTLKGERNSDNLDLRISAVFLKRALNDLRATWICIAKGYVSQAAAVAASLFENALLASVVAGNEETALQIVSGDGESPWGTKALCKKVVKGYADLTPGSREALDAEDHLYAQYKWLCKIKHPTLKSAVHDALSSSMKAGEYTVMIVPDFRPENDGMKAMVLKVSILRMHQAIRSFVIALGKISNTQELADFEKFEKLGNESFAVGFTKHYDKPIPLTINSSQLAKEYIDRKGRGK